MPHVWLAIAARIVGICRTYCPHMFHLTHQRMPSLSKEDNYLIRKERVGGFIV